MVFGLFGGGGSPPPSSSPDKKEAAATSKLQQARHSQELVINEELKNLQLDHELQRQTLTQKGLIAKQQLDKSAAAAAAVAAAAAKANPPPPKRPPSSATTSAASAAAATAAAATKKPLGPRQKLAQHVEMARQGYEQLVHAIVRPPRASYKPHHLGDVDFTFLGRRFHRDDFTLLTERGYRIQCSHWRRSDDDDHDDNQDDHDDHDDHKDKDTTTPSARARAKAKASESETVVVYMHGNASARVEVFQQLSYLLSLGTSVLSFDFAGSGLSDGEYVSLGYYEREDLATVVAHLRATQGNQVKIALWGRSMGASAALMYASREASLPIQNVCCMILDSSFCDLVQLATEMVDKARDQGIGVPNVVVSVALAVIGWSVKSKANFDINDISPIQHAPHIHIPALFVCGEHDDFIKPHHTEYIAEGYKGPKNLLMVPGDHNDLRPPVVFAAATQFLCKHLLEGDNDNNNNSVAADKGLPVPTGLNLQTAPWQHRRNPAIYQAHKPKASPLAAAAAKPSAAAAAAVAASSSSSSSQPPPPAHSDSTLSAAVDPMELGMTKERQDDIQSSLVTMLGHDTTKDEISSRTGIQSPASSSSRQSSSPGQEKEEAILLIPTTATNNKDDQLEKTEVEETA